MFRNTLLFLAPTSRGLNKLRSAYRERAALRGVQTDHVTQLDEEQRVDLKSRLDVAEQSAGQALGPAYTTVLRVSGSDVEVAALTDARTAFADHLAYVWEQLVGDDHEWILRRVGSVTLDKVGLVPKERGHRLRDAIEAFLRFTDKPMIASKDAVTAGVAQACRDGVLGIGRGISLAALQASYCRESVALDPTEEGLWIIPAFEKATTPATTVPPTGGGSAGPTQPGVSGPASTQSAAAAGKGAGGATAPRIRRIGVKGAVPAENWSDVFKAFVGPAARSTKVKLRIGLDISVHAAEGLDASDPMVQTMREAARQLGLDIEVEE